MPVLVIPRGLPGSGKSTYARARASAADRTVVVSLDSLREMLKGSRKAFHKAKGSSQPKVSASLTGVVVDTA